MSRTELFLNVAFRRVEDKLLKLKILIYYDLYYQNALALLFRREHENNVFCPLGFWRGILAKPPEGETQVPEGKISAT